MLSTEKKTYRILFIQSYTNSTPWRNELIAGLQEGLEQEGVKADIVIEYLDADFWTFASEYVIIHCICKRTRLRKADLIVTSNDEAFFTLTHCGDPLPYQVPVVVSGIKYPDEKMFEKVPNVSGFTSKTDFTTLLEEAIYIFPGHKETVCLSDSNFLNLKGARIMEEAWIPFKEEHPEYSSRKLNVQTKSISSIITSICYDYNACKYVVIVPRWIPSLSLKLKAPTFTSQNLAMTNGILCVYDMKPATDIYAAGRQTASILEGDFSVSYGVENLDGKLLSGYKQPGLFHIGVENVEEQGSILNIPLMNRCKIWFVLFYSVTAGTLVALIVWLYRSNRHELRKCIQAQTRLMIQQRLVEQRDRFDKMFCSIHNGLITCNMETHIHFVNRALAGMLGLSSDTYMARSYEGQVAGSIFHIHMDDENILPTLLEQAVRDKKPVVIPERAFTQENMKGTCFSVSGEVASIFARDKLTGTIIVCRSISEDEMQRRSFGMAIEENSIYPWQHNTRLKYFHFPVGLLKRFGYSDHTGYISREELDRVIHPEDLLHIRKHFNNTILGHKPNSRIGFRLQNTAGGYEWWEFRSAAYGGLTADIPYMVLDVCQNIQRYKNTEDELVVTRDKALQADKLKSAFLTNMNYETRTPLNAIIGFPDLLKGLEGFSSEEVQQFMETININCTLLLALVNDILDLPRMKSGTMDFCFPSYNLTSIMRQVCDSQRLSMLQEVELRTDFPEGTGKLMITDSVRLKQVANNLVNNAEKFTTKGYILLGYRIEDSGHTVISVEDTGSGIPDENLEHIFEHFYKADSLTQGAGLRLNICQTIVERLNDAITATSKLGKGTRFEVGVSDKTI